MSKNNPVGSRPIDTPILMRMQEAINKVFKELLEALKELEKEINSVNVEGEQWKK